MGGWRKPSAQKRPAAHLRGSPNLDTQRWRKSGVGVGTGIGIEAIRKTMRDRIVAMLTTLGQGEYTIHEEWDEKVVSRKDNR